VVQVSCKRYPLGERLPNEVDCRTGDQGLILSGGQLQLTGRIKELINRGGEKLAPLEIDAAILSVEGVAEAVCFGVDDPKYGEVVWAGVVLKPGYGYRFALITESTSRHAIMSKMVS
jgi:acyl-CoA synthetase (AMP-forming)/AMP-acid ligase II